MMPVLQPDTVEILADVMAREHAVAAYPLITGPSGSVGWTPGLRDRHLHRLGDKEVSPSSYRRSFGNEVADFDWAQGICLLVSRDAVDSAGFHRDDFWVRGEDLDFSLKMTAQGRGIFAPQAQAQHLPPESVGGSATGEYLRHAAMVQNIAFLAFTQAHGKRLRGSVAGAARRFIKLWGIRALPDLARAFWRGAQGEPAGAGHGRTFQRRFDELA
jgi:GT2 family glycosyltransferase